MKYPILSAICLFILNTSIAQVKVPQVVEAAFVQLYAGVEKPFWEHREGAIVAMFSAEDGLKKVFFKEDGEWLETRTRMNPQSLPTGVLSFIDQYYKNADISFTGKVDRPDGVFYRVESELTSAIIIKLLNEQGDLLEEQKIDMNNTQSVEFMSDPLPSLKIRPELGEKK